MAGGRRRRFDYWYYDESTDAKGGTSSTYYRFDCAIVPDRGRLPASDDRPGERVLAAGGRLCFHDIQFESEEFNRRFTVHCEDPKFANDLIDARMMQWLLASASGYGFEVLGQPACSSPGPRSARTAFTGCSGVAAASCSMCPKVVSSLYPG